MSVNFRKLRKSRAGRAGLVVGGIAGGVVGGLLVLDLIGFVVTVYFSAELTQYAQRAGVAGMLPQ